MGVLNRYIISEVLKGSAVAQLVLLSLFNFFTFTDELGDMGVGEYGMKQIFEFLALTTPRAFYELMPSAALLGSLVTLGALANNRELVAMQAAGASKLRIILSVVQGGLILATVSAAVGEYVAPQAEQEANMIKTTAMKEQITSRTKYGFWVRDGDIYINIRQIQQQEHLGDISIYQVDGHRQLTSATHAARATYLAGKWKLEKIRSTRFGDNQVSSEFKPTDDWSSILAPDLLNVFVVMPESLSANDLAKYMTYLRDNGQNSLSVEVAFWDRIVNPFVILVMLLVAVPFVLSLRRDVSFGQRIVLGVTLGLGFYLFDRMFGHFGQIYEMNPIFAASFPTLLMFMAAMTAILRLR